MLGADCAPRSAAAPSIPRLFFANRCDKKGTCFSQMVNRLITSVDVFRGYDLHIDFNINYQQILQGLDCIEAV